MLRIGWQTLHVVLGHCQELLVANPDGFGLKWEVSQCLH